MKILIIEDDQSVAELERDYLEINGGFQCDLYTDGTQGLQAALAGDYALVIVDVMLPGLSGFEICRRLREVKDTPVIIISARDRESEKVKALDMGADDYIVKPFGVSELLARIRTTLRRSDRLKLSQGSQKDVYHIKDLTVDIAKHQVLLDGEEIHFTQNEFKILELLCIHAGKVLTYDFILEHVWGPYGSTSNQILRVNMANIRRKLKENPSDPKYVLTELGIGYRMLED